MGMGVAAGSLFFPISTPAPLESSGIIAEAPVDIGGFSDSRTISLLVSTVEGAHLKVARSGLVTASSCSPGVTIKSGSTMVSIDGQPILALATSQPLWREFPVGSTGRDVDVLFSALRELGIEIKGQTVTRSVLRSYEGLLKSIGVSTAITSIEPSDLMWLPASEVTVSSCDLHIGGEISGRTTVATLPPTVSSITLKEVPGDLTPGDRMLIIDGIEIPTDDQGNVIAPEALNLISQTQSFVRATTTESEVIITASWSLVEPVESWTIPPSAIVVGKTGTCIVVDGKPTAITIVGSQLGQTFVVPQDSSLRPNMVSLSPSDLSQCE
jgi:hypothetical protein